MPSSPPFDVFKTAIFKLCVLSIDMSHVDRGVVTRPFVVPRADEYVGSAVCKTQNFEPHVVHAMRSFITAGSTVIDAGGNLGTYAVQFSHWVGARGRVLAFEPQPLLYKVLVANALAAGTGNMEVYHAALGFKEGSTQMASKLPDGKNSGREYDEVMAGGSGMFKVNFGGRSLGAGGEVVPMLTLDSLGLTDVSFIKLDVQGAESMVLYGARRTVLREKPSISMEDGAFFKKMFASDEMVRALGMPSEVARFDGHAWLLSVGYTEVMRSGSDVFFSHPEQRRKAEPPREVSWPGSAEPEVHSHRRAASFGAKYYSRHATSPPTAADDSNFH